MKEDMNKSPATSPSGFLGGHSGFPFIILYIIMLLLLFCTSNRINVQKKYQLTEDMAQDLK